jgi:SAP domain
MQVALNSLRKNELQLVLRFLGLSVGGLKQQLLDRIGVAWRQRSAPDQKEQLQHLRAYPPCDS